jgi:hypothetical protein
MVARVTATQVKEIISTSISDTILTTNMIDTANLYVNTYLDPDAGYTEAYLAKIELYLAAHFTCITEEEGARVLSKLGDASDEWAADWFGPGFQSTRYGQAALTLDTSGILANVGSAALKAEFRVV